MPRPLTPEEESLAALLHRAGLRRAEARCLTLLLRAGGGGSGGSGGGGSGGGSGVSRKDAAAATGLLPQDVSDAMRALEDAGAARVEAVAREGPGRRPLRYRLAADAGEVLRALEARRRAQVEAELAALDELRLRF